MKRSISFISLIMLMALLVSASGAAARGQDLANPASELAVPQGTTFTYQGRLEDVGEPVNNYCDFEFKLFASPEGSDQVGGTQPRDNVLVVDGYFTVDDLDFGAGAFQREARWLEVAVRCPTSSGGFETLLPRQELTAAPYALYSHAAPWEGLTSVPPGFADGVDNDTTYTPGTGMILSGGGFSLVSTYRLPQGCANGQIAEWSGSAWICANDDVGSGSVHNHWGQSWSGSGTGLTLAGGSIGLHGGGSDSGVQGSSNATNGKGVLGDASAGSGTNYGVYGQSHSTAGFGVYGQAVAESGTNYGVAGYSSSTSGRGVYGWAGASSGTTYGVYSQSSSASGMGVYGTGGIGVYGQSQSSTGVGVYGSGDVSSGRGGIVQPVGMYGDTYSGIGVAGITTDGTGVFGSSMYSVGVYGEAFANSGVNNGVIGLSYSTSGQGVVGDATATEGTTYGIIGYSASPDGYAGYFRNTSSGVSLRAQSDSGSGNIIEAWSSFADREFRVERGGNVYADGSFTGGGGDYAELLPGAATVEPGDVLVIGPDGQLTPSTQPYQASVAGVYSTQPGFVAGAGDESADLNGLVPLAVMGVVPVKVCAENGPIQPGDLLTSSSLACHAMRAGVDPVPGTIIGKALEPWKAGSGVTKMLVMMR